MSFPRDTEMDEPLEWSNTLQPQLRLTRRVSNRMVCMPHWISRPPQSVQTGSQEDTRPAYIKAKPNSTRRTERIPGPEAHGGMPGSGATNRRLNLANFIELFAKLVGGRSWLPWLGFLANLAIIIVLYKLFIGL